MITSFEVGAVLKVIDQASPALRKVLTQLRELNATIEKAKTGLSSLLTSLNGELDPAIAQTRELAASWRSVSTAAQGARRSLTSATRASAAVAMPRIPRGGGFGGFARGGGRGGHGGFGVSSFGAPIPGGHAHFRVGSDAAMIGAGALGYGMYEEAHLEDSIWQMMFHAGMDNTAANRQRLRDIIQSASSKTGFSMRDVSDAAIDEVRMLRGTPDNGIGILPTLLRAAATEARAKGGTSLQEAMSSLIGMAHMDQAYTPSEMEKLLPNFAFLSASTDASLEQIKRAGGYAMPILRSSLNVDPMQSLLMEIALQRAGITNTKSGTWIREMALRAMPGTSMMSRTAFQRHEEALSEVGLVDGKGNPTWFSNGAPDLIKMLTIAGENLKNIPLTKRAGIERSLFGAQGSGAIAILSDPVVQGQLKALQADMPRYKSQYGTFMEDYSANSPVQKTRQSWADLQVVLANIGSKTLPPVVGALRDFDAVLNKIRAAMPGSDPQKSAAAMNIGKTAVEGATIGAGVGFFAGGVGAVPGAAIGGVIGGTWGAVENLFKSGTEGTQQMGNAAASAGHQAEAAAGGIGTLTAAISRLISALSSAAGAAAGADGILQKNMYVPAPPGGGGVHHTSIIQIDGNEVGRASVQYIADRATRPMQGSSYHDATWQAPATDHAYSI